MFITRYIKRLRVAKYWPARILIWTVVFLILNWIFPLPGEKDFSQVILASDGSLMNAYLTEDDKWRMHTYLDEVSPDMTRAITQKEDKWFYYHFGFNPVAMSRALFNNVFTGRRTSGASTITMQLARMMEPKRRNYLNKMIEVFRSMQLELKYSKKEILELYLSYLPYGGNVEGVKAASYIYFDRSPEQLSLSQSVLLAVIPNRPNSLRLDKHTGVAMQARDKWLRRFEREEVFPKEQIVAAIEEPVETKRYQIEPFAPHFCQELHYNRFGHAEEIQTTLDPKIQQITERLLAKYVNRVRNRGVSNGAVIVVENEGAAVRGYCGSADFYDDLNGGQNNGTKAVRSPGSALKPSLYALGFDEGIITPKTHLLDIPVNFSGYAPENYDLTFHGSVTTEYALRNSLNIPPVRLLNTIGTGKYFDLMKSAGFETIEKQRKDLGLSVILGGCGVTLEELVRLYAAFANKGKMYPLAYTQEQIDSLAEPKQLYSAASSWMIAEILSGIERPDMPNEYLAVSGNSKIAWKTGTSHGKRDGWAIGFSPKYTIGVWVGNFDGKGASDLSGAVMAVPLLFELFNGIDNSRPEDWFVQPPSVYERKVCAETGNVPSGLCRLRVEDFFIRNVSHSKTCGLEREVYTSEDSTIQYCTECLPEKSFVKQVYPLYVPELALWMEDNQRKYLRPPKHNPDCEAILQTPGPKIISPSADYEYLVQDGAGQEILLQAASDAMTDRHYWFVNKQFYKSCLPGERIFFEPAEGTYELSCMDNNGRESHVKIVVKVY